MNLGGDPGRDDYGLPPVDIEIPDDARELDRDVLAYHRELRTQRRRMLVRRLYAPLSRDGMVLPLLAGCLALTLLAGTLLTVLTTGRGTVTSPSARTTSGQKLRRLAPGEVGTLLPDRVVMVDGQPESLRQLGGVTLVLALVPPGCLCTPGVQQLAYRATRAGAVTYLVGTQSPQLITLSERVGLGKSRTVVDFQRALPSFYRPRALGAVLVRADGTVLSIALNPVHDRRFLARLRMLAPPSLAPASPAPGSRHAPASTKALPRPGRSVPAFAILAAFAG